MMLNYLEMPQHRILQATATNAVQKSELQYGNCQSLTIRYLMTRTRRWAVPIWRRSSILSLSWGYFMWIASSLNNFL